MRSLANLLEAAVGRSATDVLLESGQPVVFTTTRGPEVEQSMLPRTDLFDMIVAAVDDSQQIELAVGNPVRFTIEAGATWTVIAEPGIDGMIVRAHRPDPAPALEIELEDEPSFALGDNSFSVRDETFGDEFDDDFGGDFAAAPTARARVGSQPLPLPLDEEPYDTPTLQGHDAEQSRPNGQAPAAPFESGTWALADEDDFDVGLDESDDQLPRGFGEPPPGYDPRHIGVPQDDDDAGGFDPFAAESARPRTGEHRRQPAEPVAREPVRPRPTVADTPTRRELSPASRTATQAATRRELPVTAPEADTRRELPSVGRAAAGIGGLAQSIDEGVLVYVRGPGLADSLAQSIAAPSVTVDDQLEPKDVFARVRGLPVGTIVIVRREDPSTMLDWILRRLEEGFRVFVETRARTVEGARRILLGVGATDRAERWLDSQVTLVVEPGESGPQLREAS